MIGIKAAKRAFFDRAKVIRMMDRRTARGLARFGGLVRKTAQGLIRTGKKSAAPGQPPKSHVGLLRKFIYFFYSDATKSVVIGPAKLAASGRSNVFPASGSVPELLERGGAFAAADKAGKRRPGRMAARPFMGPALAKKQRDLPRMFKE